MFGALRGSPGGQGSWNKWRRLERESRNKAERQEGASRRRQLSECKVCEWGIDLPWEPPGEWAGGPWEWHRKEGSCLSALGGDCRGAASHSGMHDGQSNGSREPTIFSAMPTPTVSSLRSLMPPRRFAQRWGVGGEEMLLFLMYNTFVFLTSYPPVKTWE